MNLFKRIAMIFVVICCFLTLFGVGYEVNAVEETITINCSDTFTPAFPIASPGNATVTGHTDSSANDFKFKEKGIYKSTDTYLMFYKNNGYLYNTESLGTIKSIAITYSSGTSTSAKVGVYFDTAELATYTTTDNITIAGQSKTNTFTNDVNGNGFFQLSTSNKNCQITTIVITYDKSLGAAIKLDAPTDFTVDGNNVIVSPAVTNANGYKAGIFADETSTTPLYEFSSSNTTIAIKDIPQNTPYVLKVAATGTGSYTDSDYFSTATPATFTNTSISEYTVTKIKSDLPTQETAPWIYYQVRGIIFEIDNSSFAQLTIKDNISDEIYLTVLGIEGFNAADYSVGDTLVLKGYKSNSQLKGTVVLEHIIDHGNKFSILETNNSLKFSYTTGSTHVDEQEGWSLVTNTNDLKNDDSIVFVTKDKDGNNIELTGFSTTSTVYGLGTEYTTLPEGSYAFEYGVGSTADTVSFKHDSNYLYWNTGNSLKTNTVLSSNSSWKLSIDDSGNATIKNATDESRVIWWNVSSPRFACYTDKSDGESYKYIQIYKKIIIPAHDEPTYSNFSMSSRFGSMITKELYDNLLSQAQTVGKTIEFGVSYTKTTYLDQHITITPVRVNDEGVADINGNYYQFALVFNDIPEINWNTKITAACYVKIGDTYYHMIERTKSVKDIAAAYINEDKAGTYENVLTYIKNK